MSEFGWDLFRELAARYLLMALLGGAGAGALVFTVGLAMAAGMRSRKEEE